MPEPASIDSTLRALARHPFRALARHPFRARFHPRGRDAATVELRAYVVNVICRWIERDLAAGRRAPR